MFAYAPKVYRDYLRAKLPDDVRVTGRKMPATKPARLVTIRMVPAGPSPKPRSLAWRRLIFQCMDVDDIATGELCELVRDEVVNSVYAGIGARRVKVIGEPGDFPDPDDDSPRSQTTIDILFRANS